jgi:hypothetical protein
VKPRLINGFAHIFTFKKERTRGGREGGREGGKKEGRREGEEGGRGGRGEGWREGGKKIYIVQILHFVRDDTPVTPDLYLTHRIIT